MIDWPARAACKGSPTAWFFPEPRETVAPEAVVLCGSCTVRPECLAYALTEDIKHGWWGGLSPEERKLRRAKSA